MSTEVPSFIHPTAVVDPKAEIGECVQIGPFAIVEKGVRIGQGNVIDARAVIHSGVILGDNNYVGVGCVLGGAPQDRKYKGAPTHLTIGNDNVFREYVTIHRGTAEGTSTVVGNRNYLMAYSHLGHNVTIEDDVTIANAVGVSGYVTIERGANIGGMTGIHQYVRVGRYSMIGGMSRVTRDVPPFMLTEGSPPRVYDINSVGLRRAGIPPNVRMELHKACKILFRSEMNLSRAIEMVRNEVSLSPEVEYLLEFLENMRQGRYGRQQER
ncbi:MAG: acyl-ACP--UDP-N-acetylglucosamine O-acyltransferase [Fimbriimonadales bacterium]|nr:acyl-ACP--UDP-N-acetylglucosamine O-acyltransferase [Fimbriimonadales bacterium]